LQAINLSHLRDLMTHDDHSLLARRRETESRHPKNIEVENLVPPVAL